MTTAATIYIAGAPLVALAAATRAEIDRRNSDDPEKREATLEPGLIGITYGALWPAGLALALVVAVLGLIALTGRAGAALIVRRRP